MKIHPTKFMGFYAVFMVYYRWSAKSRVSSLLSNTGQQPGPKSGCVNFGSSGTPKLISSLTLLGSELWFAPLMVILILLLSSRYHSRKSVASGKVEENKLTLCRDAFTCC